MGTLDSVPCNVISVNVDQNSWHITALLRTGFTKHSAGRRLDGRHPSETQAIDGCD